MKRHFIKMHGCGNDYIFFDCLSEPFPSPEEAAIRLSDRRFSIGGDGIVLICPSERADARMRMFNADGSEGKMCGNAARCIGKYLYERVGLRKETLTLETPVGVRSIHIQPENERIAVDMGIPELEGRRIPVDADGRIIRRSLEVAGKQWEITCVSMGNPHCVVFTDDLTTLDLAVTGPAFERHPFFPERVNAEFVQVLDERALAVSVWERGSGETLACGTGACAAVVAATLCGYCSRQTDVEVRLPGGTLYIYWNDTVKMEGPASVSFEGEVEV